MFPFSITSVERILGCDKILLLLIFPQHLEGIMDKPSKWHVIMAILEPSPKKVNNLHEQLSCPLWPCYLIE